MNGSIYWDESSRGYHGNAGHTPYTRGRWVISEDVPVISISSTISSLCHQMLKEQRKKREYNDNIKIFER